MMIDMMRGSHTGQGNETPYDIVLGIVILGVVVVRAKAGGFVGQVSARADHRTGEERSGSRDPRRAVRPW